MTQAVWVRRRKHKYYRGSLLPLECQEKRWETSLQADSETVDVLVDKLTALGFSVYEAKAYLGLLGNGSQTGYALSKETGVPEPKVYETLRRLVARRVVIQVDERPARFAAVPSDQLLARMEEAFDSRLEAARHHLQRAQEVFAHEWEHSLWRSDSDQAIFDRGTKLIGQAEKKVYISGRADELQRLSNVVADASKRGVEFCRSLLRPEAV